MLACFAALIYGLLRHALYEQTDRSLQAGFALLRGDPRASADADERLHFWIEEYKEHQNLLCVVYRPDGTLHARTEGLADESVPPLAVSRNGKPDREVYDERLPGIGRQRIMA